jgi:hypothetical protein
VLSWKEGRAGGSRPGVAAWRREGGRGLVRPKEEERWEKKKGKRKRRKGKENEEKKKGNRKKRKIREEK